MRFAYPGYGPASHRPGLGPPSAGCGIPARSPDKAAGRIRGIGCASSAGRHVHGAPDALRLSGLRTCTLERLIADAPERESPRPDERRAGASPGRGRGPQHPGSDSIVGTATRALRPGRASLIRATCGRGPDPCAQSQAARTLTPSHPHTLTPSHPRAGAVGRAGWISRRATAPTATRCPRAQAAGPPGWRGRTPPGTGGRPAARVRRGSACPVRSPSPRCW
jgi:hypothetical protein